MTKMRRKLDAYLIGDRKKKAPKRRVKWCPLSPCKSLKTPIFQLHKHLQTSIHQLKPNSSGYLKALAEAPRASVTKLDSFLKRKRKIRQKRKSKDNSDTNNEQAEDSKTENEMGGACEREEDTYGEKMQKTILVTAMKSMKT